MAAEAELQRIAFDNGLKVFSKIRISDVLQKTDQHLTSKHFSMLARGHFDFVVADFDTRPILAVEYDGPSHSNPIQIARDEAKDWLCRTASFPILRINDNHINRLYRGMTTLRWIIEVIGLEKEFYKAQRSGQIPHDEPFDPTTLSVGEKRFPYWISFEATQKIQKFVKSARLQGPAGWFGFVGIRSDKRKSRLSVINFNDKLIYSMVSIKQQGVEFPDYDLLAEIDTCSLEEQLSRYLAGSVKPHSAREFEPVFTKFCVETNAHPSFAMGEFPLKKKWNFSEGWKP